MKDITIITISSDNRSYLGPCLDALKMSKNGFSYDIIAVDNSSKDGSAQFVKERYPDISLIEGKTRQGFSFNNNLGIKKSYSKYILLLNVDTVIEPETLKIMLRFMEDNPDCGLAGCKLYDMEGKIEFSCKEFPSLLNIFLEALMLERVFPKNRILGKRIMGYFDRNSVRQVDWVCGAFMFVRHSVVEQAGLLDDNFFMYYEDVDWCYRIRKSGWNIYYVPATKILHHKGAGTKGFSAWAYVENYRGLLLFYKKHHTFIKQITARSIILCGMAVRFLLIIPAIIVLAKRRKELAQRLNAYLKVAALSLRAI